MVRTLKETLAELESLWPKGAFPGSHPKIFAIQEELVDMLCELDNGACMLALSEASDIVLEGITSCVEPLIEEKPGLIPPLTALAQARGIDDLIDELSIIALEGNH